jgi:phosphotransacetylase
MSEVTAVNDQITDSVTQVKPSDVMYGKKEEAAAPVAAEVKTEETKAPTDTSQEKSVEAKAQEESAKPKEEIKYDLKLPEGSLLTQAEVDKIVSFSKEQGLSQESAQKLVESEHNIIANYQEQQEQQF